MLKTLTTIAEKHTYLLCAFLSLLISLWLFASKDIISRDGALYIEAAQAFYSGGIGAVFAVWKWPFYPIIISTVHKLTGLGFEHSAYLLTILFETIISVTFVKIYSKIAFDGARLWVAMLFILTFVALSGYKAEILRGHGFWAFMLIAIYQFITYFQTRQKVSAILWQLSVFVAALFRPEAVVFAALAPLYFLFNHGSLWVDKIKHLLVLNSIFFPIGLLLLGIIVFLGYSQDSVLNNLSGTFEYFLPEKVFQNFNIAADSFVKHVLLFDYAARYSHLILASGLLSMLLFKVINNLTLVYTGIWLTGSYKGWVSLKSASYIIYYFAFIAFLILGVFLTSRLFISSRYTVLLLLIMGLIITQYIDCLFSILCRQKKKIGVVVFSTFIAAQFIDSVVSTGAKKLPIKQASEWLVQHIKPGERIACNEARYAHYTQQKCYFTDRRFYEAYSQADIEFLKNNNYIYLLLWVKYKNNAMQKLLDQDESLVLLRRFENRKKDAGLVYIIK